MKIQKISKKAFTLIELMIVVVILGVLMSTILPKLTGAQARARDTARISDILNISTALQTYYDDNGEYPSSTGSTVGECLTDSGPIGSAIKIYMQNGSVPRDPQDSSNSHLCTTTKGSYYYMPLKKDGLDKNAFVLCADMETYQKSNTNASLLVGTTAVEAGVVKDGTTDAGSTDNDYEDAQEDVEALKTNAQKESADATSSYTVNCIIRP